MDVLPAHALNEFVYCPRLFHLAEVDGESVDSEDIVLGRVRHQDIDVAHGTVPGPDDERPHQTRSMTLSSASLGITARLDIVESDSAGVRPVEVKKGRSRPDGQPWPSDRVQAVAQAMLLAEHGYLCDQAVVYYAAQQRRVSIPVTAEETARVRSVIAEATAARGRPQPPPPLVNSPRCPPCSLAGTCLPDETNQLTGRGNRPARVLPRDPDERPVHIIEPGSTAGVRRGRLIVTKNSQELASYRLLDVAQLAVFGPAQVSTQALHALFARNIPILWFSSGGWLRGWAVRPSTTHAELRRRQAVAHTADGWGIPWQLIAGKIHNAHTMLRRHHAERSASAKQLPRLARQARDCDSTSALRGIEGSAARIYFGDLPAMLRNRSFAEAFRSHGRNRRPPTDPVNACLSFCYGLLVKDLLAAALAAGLDPALGLYHHTRAARPALALDLAEEFRPLIADSAVLRALNHRELTESDFVRTAGAVTLTHHGRQALIRAHEKRLADTVRHPVFGYRISYRRVLDVQVRLFAATLLGELDHYPPMTTR